MNRELEFAKKIEEIRELAKAQGGVLSKAQVEETFVQIGFKENELGPVYDYLKTKRIGIDEKVNVDEYLSEDEVDYLNMYLESLAELPTYSDGEKRAFYMSAMAGDRDAKDRVIEIMLSDVVDMAKLYTGQGMFVEDLIGEGNVALSLAVDMLGALEEPDEVPTTLAAAVMTAMENAISVEIDEKKVDDKLVNRVNKVAAQAEELAQALGRKVTVEELVAEGKTNTKEVLDAIRLSGGKIEDIETPSEIK